MKILIFADLRSPHARGWIAGLEELGHDVTSVASIPGPDVNEESARSAVSRRVRNLPPRLANVARTAEAAARQRSRARALAQAVTATQPDVVHALRLPYEGVAALTALRGSSVPLVVSSWGQDFVLQTKNDPALRVWVRRVLPRVAGFVADVPEDLMRARDHGLGRVPTLVAAANFGLRVAATAQAARDSRPLVTYTRGLSPYVRYNAFLEAIPLVLSRTDDDVRFLGIGLQEEPEAVRLASQASTGSLVEFTGRVSLDQFRTLIDRSTITVSPAVSDGMPISVLESLAAGCTTLVGPLPQYRDLCGSNPHLRVMAGVTAEDIADAVVGALADAHRQREFAPRLPEPYDYARNLVEVDRFYESVGCA